MKFWSSLQKILLSLAMLCICTIGQAQTMTSRPTTLVVPFQAGSPTDLVARALANDLTEMIGSPVIVDNRPGASQTVAGIFVARAPADGHTLFLANLPAVVAPSVQRSLPYTGIRDFAAIAHVADVSLILALAPSVPATNLNDFIALLRANPSSYPYFSAGVGSPIHMLTEVFNLESGVHTVHVPYKGVPAILPDLMAGRVAYGFLQVGAMEYVRSNKIKALGLVARNRDPLYPELPTIAEAGMSNFTYTVPYVLVAAKGTPSADIARLNAATNKIIASERFRSKLKGIGVQIAQPNNPAQAADFIAAEEKRWDDLLKAANITLGKVCTT